MREGRFAIAACCIELVTIGVDRQLLVAVCVGIFDGVILALRQRRRREDTLPPLHSLIDLCNAVSATWALPVAAIDLAGVRGLLEVRPADGDETYEAFDGTVEHPRAGGGRVCRCGARAARPTLDVASKPVLNGGSDDTTGTHRQRGAPRHGGD